jgi:hypothetical protein
MHEPKTELPHHLPVEIATTSEAWDILVSFDLPVHLSGSIGCTHRAPKAAVPLLYSELLI